MFSFSDQLPIPAEATLVVPIPETVQTKQQLLEALAEGLNFPSYFGRNWDALDECLCDLSWIPFPRPIMLFHEAVPFTEAPTERSIYLDILKHAMQDLESGRLHTLVVVFPTAFAVDPEAGDGGP